MVGNLLSLDEIKIHNYKRNVISLIIKILRKDCTASVYYKTTK